MKVTSVAVLAAFAACFCDAALQVFTAQLQALESSNVSGEVTIFASSTGLQGVGSATGLETNVSADAADCTATNGCGVHVHSGTSCDNTTTQGGHYFFTGGSDPWSSIGYSSSSNSGDATFNFDVTNSATDISGKPFIIHNKSGGRVACGILSEVTTGVTEASLTDLSSTGVSGSVTIIVSGSVVVGAGSASGLEASLSDTTNCTATNGCGVHVHSGSGCTDTTTQGGHYFSGSSDPWAYIRYSSTTAAGAANFCFAVTSTGATAVQGKAFLVHNNAGGRVSCGLLTDATVPSPSPSPSPSTDATDAASPCTAAGISLFGSVLLGSVQYSGQL